MSVGYSYRDLFPTRVKGGATVERVAYCPYTRSTWPTCGAGCILSPDQHALTCVMHGVEIGVPHGLAVPCDACRGRFRPRAAVPEPPKPWALDHAYCRTCLRTDRRHQAGGLCTTCYTSRLRHGRDREALR